MRIIKLGFISLLALGLLITLLSLLLPSHVRISRAITINKDASSVRKQVMDIKQWANWNALLQQKDLKNAQFRDDGFSSDEMKVQLISKDSNRIETEWTRNGQDKIKGVLELTPSEGATVVQWYFDFHLKWYPWEKFGSIIFDGQIGPPMQKSLDQLDMIVQ